MEQITILSDFAKDTLHGLSSPSKYLKSKYFYDKRGSEIFQDIMRMPEYYLTDCELEIFQLNKQNLLNDFIGTDTNFELVELGAGDGLKTKILLSYFLSKGIDFKYTPIDISEIAITNLVNDLKSKIPKLIVNGRVGDYFKMIGDLKSKNQQKRIILFLGSNIGNFNEQMSVDFLSKLKSVMNPQDMVFIGFDLKKDSEIILKAYNDPHGYTAEFNLNILHRINVEMDADFNLQDFSHNEVYDYKSGTAKSFLISKSKQQVNIRQLNKTISFDKSEKIFVEISQKYDSQMVNSLADKSGFEIVRNYRDHRLYFMNSLWKPQINNGSF